MDFNSQSAINLGSCFLTVILYPILAACPHLQRWDSLFYNPLLSVMTDLAQQYDYVTPISVQTDLHTCRLK